MGSKEIAALLHLAQPATFHTLLRRHRERGIAFPEPVTKLSGVPIWHRPDVVRWGVEQGYLNEDGSYRGKPRGRPRKAD